MRPAPPFEGTGNEKSRRTWIRRLSAVLPGLDYGTRWTGLSMIETRHVVRSWAAPPLMTYLIFHQEAEEPVPPS